MANFTPKVIKASFKRLLMKKAYDSLTVKDIVTDCGINRNSFYYHFKDIPNLIENIIRDDCDYIIGSISDSKNLESMLDIAYKYVEDNKNIILRIYKTIDRRIYEKYIWQSCEYAIKKVYEKNFNDIDVTEEDRDFILHYYSCLAFGYIISWLDSDMKYDIKSAYKRLCELKSDEIQEILKRCKK